MEVYLLTFSGGLGFFSGNLGKRASEEDSGSQNSHSTAQFSKGRNPSDISPFHLLKGYIETLCQH